MSDNYRVALEAAGAEVLAFESFGSYQGDWFAKVKFDGQVGFLHGYYGSCSGCDAFEGEFGWGAGHCDEHRWDWDEAARSACSACAAANAEYDTKLQQFGRNYLDEILTFDAVMVIAKENESWDMKSEEMVKWLLPLADPLPVPRPQGAE